MCWAPQVDRSVALALGECPFQHYQSHPLYRKVVIGLTMGLHQMGEGAMQIIKCDLHT